MKNIVITAGGTSEKIDNVRKITNSSTGKLGLAIANKFLEEMEDIHIYYVCSKTAFRPQNEKVDIIEIEGTMELKSSIEYLLTNEKIDYFIHSMAVSDYMTNYVTTLSNIRSSESLDNISRLSGSKISSYLDDLVIVLKPTPKIISIIKSISPATFLVGFKLLDGVSEEELLNVAKNLMNKNDCDLVVANDLSYIRNGEHIAYIIDRQDKVLSANGKDDIASKLVKRINVSGL